MKSMVNVILTGTPSDSHIWNLIFMELFLRENGCQVLNLGACVPIASVRQAIVETPPDLVVISSLNGHLFQDAIEIMNSLSKSLLTLPRLVVGGNMGISVKDMNFQKKKLLKLGYDGVFIENDSLPSFIKYLYRFQRNIHPAILKHAL